MSLVPALLLLGVAEAILRVGGLARPALQATGVPGEESGLIRHDEELFWSLQPDLRRAFKGAIVSINALGLRGPALGPKEPGELRILSLGESSTFGIGVGDAETYTSRVAEHLGAALPGRVVRAANAGVPAWSSFQSLKYLELRGLALEPDWVLFYHELNDYLPSTLRDSSRTEIGALETDRELYESGLQRTRRALLQRSALYRFLSYQLARRRIDRFRTEAFENPLLGIGLPDIGLAPRLRERESGQVLGGNEWALGRRVSDAERLQNLEELRALSEREGFRLVVIHPSYGASSRHECLLTRFCAAEGVPMFEAFDSLHPEGEPALRLFVDPMHPNREGHERLARDLADFLLRRVLVGPGGGPHDPWRPAQGSVR